ncbi:hypothetical protein B0O80DRAFT_500557 [Mortierella sp. GBAus27b]|nr:hypothetical protein B0O80DRAFT_500557 [Mortierella sp. GBAus27b]
MSLGLQRKAGANKAGANNAGNRADWNPSSLEFNQTGAHVVWNSLSSTDKVFVARVCHTLSLWISTKQEVDEIRARPRQISIRPEIDEVRTQEYWIGETLWNSEYASGCEMSPVGHGNDHQLQGSSSLIAETLTATSGGSRVI